MAGNPLAGRAIPYGRRGGRYRSRIRLGATSAAASDGRDVGQIPNASATDIRAVPGPTDLCPGLSSDSTPEAYEIVRELHRSGTCEICAHLQPWDNPPFFERKIDENSYPGNLPCEL